LSKNYRSDDATALVGMPEFVVGVQLFRDGEWWLNVETRADIVWCHGCGVRAVGHGRNRTQVRDVPIAGVPTVIVFARRRWRCGEALRRGAVCGVDVVRTRRRDWVAGVVDRTSTPLSG